MGRGEGEVLFEAEGVGAQRLSEKTLRVEPKA